MAPCELRVQGGGRTRSASYDLQRFVVESTAAVVQGAVVAAAAAAERAEL